MGRHSSPIADGSGPDPEGPEASRTTSAPARTAPATATEVISSRRRRDAGPFRGAGASSASVLRYRPSASRPGNRRDLKDRKGRKGRKGRANLTERNPFLSWAYSASAARPAAAGRTRRAW
ncbi:hypothetical protein GCM10009535_11420 [Streptomyces thermocarboxydovorans]|uniref:Uncharacterized protein n=1 Tax=Streptomyces thermocarboxydovorans TaxID=59298 RepID=A0ABP3SFY1_9ACTN